MSRRSRNTNGAMSYERTFKGLGENVSIAARKALEGVAERVVQTAKRLAPVKTGALQTAIVWKWNRGKTAIKISATAAKSKKGVSYGQYAEFNSMFSNDGPKPFLYPAMDAHRGEARQAIIDATREAIRKT